MKRIAYVDVLGTMYAIYESNLDECTFMKEHNLDGYCESYDRKIVISDMSDAVRYDFSSEDAKNRYRGSLLRHEIIHAFLSESGLQDSTNSFNSAWSKNEEMIDWFSIMWPKINNAFEAVGAIG